MVRSDSIIKIMPDLIKAQAEMSKPVKGSDNPFFKSKYADLSTILEACQPALNAHNIAILQPVSTKEGRDVVETLLIHSSGEFIGSEVEIKASKVNDSQAFGSAVSYARRYALQSLLGLAAIDDDGNKASLPEKKIKGFDKAAIIEKLLKASDGQDLIKRYNWFRDNKPGIVTESWFQDAYDEMSEKLEMPIDKKFLGLDIAEEAIKAGL